MVKGMPVIERHARIYLKSILTVELHQQRNYRRSTLEHNILPSDTKPSRQTTDTVHTHTDWDPSISPGKLNVQCTTHNSHVAITTRSSV